MAFPRTRSIVQKPETRLDHSQKPQDPTPVGGSFADAEQAHVEERDRADDGAEKLRALHVHVAHEKPAVAPAADPDLSRRGDAGLDQALGDGREVVVCHEWKLLPKCGHTWVRQTSRGGIEQVRRVRSHNTLQSPNRQNRARPRWTRDSRETRVR